MKKVDFHGVLNLFCSDREGEKMLALEKRMVGGNTAVHVNNQADLCDVLRTMETLVTECEKK